jgi:hypothetical protein
MALVMNEKNVMGWVGLTRYFADEPWRTAALGPERAIRGPVEGERQRHRPPVLTRPIPGVGGGRTGPELGL